MTNAEGMREYNEIRRIIKEGADFAMETARIINKCEGFSEASELISELEATVGHMIASENKMAQYRQLLDRIEQGNQEVPEDENGIPQFCKLVEELAESESLQSKINPHHSLLEKFRSITRTNEEDDEEVVLQEDETDMSTLCPILQKTIVEPYKSAECGHVYSKEGIFLMLQRRKKIKCPIAGCDRYVTQKDLVPDEDFEILLQRRLRQSQR